jgi:hypothetical protein
VAVVFGRRHHLLECRFGYLSGAADNPALAFASCGAARRRCRAAASSSSTRCSTADAASTEDAISNGMRDYVYPLNQSAATLGHHDHWMDFTGPQVYRGLAGFHLLQDDEEEELPLPKGERDVPLMVCDRPSPKTGHSYIRSLIGRCPLSQQ